MLLLFLSPWQCAIIGLSLSVILASTVPAPLHKNAPKNRPTTSAELIELCLLYGTVGWAPCYFGTPPFFLPCSHRGKSFQATYMPASQLFHLNPSLGGSCVKY